MSTFILCYFIITSHSYNIDLTESHYKFDGIGALSAGASSRLLIDYSEPYRSQILDYLFKPQFGASLDILKIEIGGDTFSTCGTEPSHMHTQNDLNFNRGYEFWLATEAKKRNSKIKLYGLSWGFPAWIGSGALNNNQVNYTIEWIKGAFNNNLIIDYIGIWNERAWSSSYVKSLKNELIKNNFTNIKLVVADMFLGGTQSIYETELNDNQFNNSFDIIGVHYPSASDNTIYMMESNKILWSSEDSSTNDDIIGGGCWGRILNWNYIYGNYTSTIMWSIISSWYEYLKYFGDGLMNAAWPWNGYYQIMTPLWITAHTTQFVKILDNNWYLIKQNYGSGILDNGGTYVTYISTINNVLNITIVIETLTYQNSLCIRDNPTDFWNVTTQNITFKLLNDKNYILPKQLYKWKTTLNGDSNDIVFEKQNMIMINDNIFTLYNIEPNTVITISTISTANKGNYPNPPSKELFPIPYSDNFENYNTENNNEPQPKYFSDQAGSFIVSNDMNTKTLKQAVPYSPALNGTSWHENSDAPQPLTIIGDYNITDIIVNVSAYIISNNQISNNLKLAWNTSNIMIGLRLGGKLSTNGCDGAIRELPCVQAIGNNWFNFGYFLQINDNGYWKLMPGANNKILIDGNLNINLQQKWFNISFSIKEFLLSGFVNNIKIFENIIDNNKYWDNGWVGLSCGWQTCYFDNFSMYI